VLQVGRARLTLIGPQRDDVSDVSRIVIRPLAPEVRAEPATPEGEIFEKIFLAFADAREMTSMLTQRPALPAEVSGILAYPLDQSLLVRGKIRGIWALRRAIAKVDVPIEQREGAAARATLRPLRGDPALLRERILALPGAGEVTLQERALLLEGSRDWIVRALGLAVQAELAAH
jgi:hypothetical protein